jgi:hypothetical protein
MLNSELALDDRWVERPDPRFLSALFAAPLAALKIPLILQKLDKDKTCG